MFSIFSDFLKELKQGFALSVLFTLIVASPAYAGQKILVFGDSLSAGYGLNADQAWPSLLQTKLNTLKYDATVVNASISGETTSGAASRVNATLKLHQPDIVILEFGGNDGLRGLSLKAMQTNLAAMIQASKNSKAKVVLVGMKIPPNYGLPYTRQFSEIYPALAKQYQTALVPFLLEGVGGNPELVQADGLHPTAAAQPKLLANVWPALKPLLQAPN